MSEEFIEENDGTLSFFKEDKGEHEDVTKDVDEFPVEYADICYKCQESHYNRKGFVDGEFPVVCKGIPKRLIDEKYYPLEEIYGDLYYQLTGEQKIQLQYKNNKIMWAKDMLNWSPHNPKRDCWQGYQEEMLTCTALRKVGRLGRRMGKSEVLTVDAIHYAMNTHIKNPRILILAPFMNLCDELHARILDKLDDSVYRGTYSSTKKPYVVEIPRPNFGDTAKIKLFTTGSGSGNAGASTRGQSGDKMFIDEAGYMDQESLEAVIPLLLEHPEVEILVTSTPSQIPNKFKEWCLTDEEFKDFHFPYTIMPNFPGEEKMLRKMYTKKGWEQEIEANFYEGTAKVFKEADIKNSLRAYRYPYSAMEIPDAQDWRFFIGVDWNAHKNGVQIIVQGVNLKTKRTKVWYRHSVNENSKRKFSEQLQTEAVMMIRDLDKRFGCEKIALDLGFGALNAEILIKMYQQEDKEDKIIPIDFASVISEKHPMTDEPINRRIKGVMVHLLQQRFEYGSIELSSLEEGDLKGDDQLGELLTTQLNYYEIEKYDARDNPVFRAAGPGTDHILDALMLSNYAIAKFVEEVFNLEGSKRAAIADGNYKLQQDALESAVSRLEQFVNNVNNGEGYNLSKKFTTSDMRDNFMEVKDSKAADEEIKHIQSAQKGRLGSKFFGTKSKRINRQRF